MENLTNEETIERERYERYGNFAHDGRVLASRYQLRQVLAPDCGGTASGGAPSSAGGR